MKRIIFTFLILLFLSPFAFSQRILLNMDFETAPLVADSLPANWLEVDVNGGHPTFPNAIWHVRDTSASFPGVNNIIHSKANNYSIKGLTIPWSGGNPIADQWVFTDSLRIQTGDSLIFWMLLGTPPDSIIGGNHLTAYLDTMQVHVCSAQDPGGTLQKLATIRSNDSAGVPLGNNVWTIHNFDLSAFNGQLIYVAFRYFMNTSADGLWCNLDDIFVGNHAAIGIHPISTNLPKVFDLRQNYPNPFNPVTNIEFSLPRAVYVSLIVYNELGQVVKELVSQNMHAGVYKVDFDATNLPSGAYFYRLNAGDFVKTNKMILTK
jgi:hypothetical protein